MKILALLFLLITLNSCNNERKNSELIIFARIEYIFNLKSMIANQIWSDFDNEIYDLPLIYYTNCNSYITNQPKEFLNEFKPKLVFKNQKIKIYKTRKRFDNVPFHMETSSSIFDSRTKVDIPYPVMTCSSFEETTKTIPDTKSTENWVTMIIHEYFHGFQFKHKSYLDSTIKFTNAVSGDSLSEIFQNNNWFQKKIKKENDYLLKAIQATNKSELIKNINDFFRLRKERRNDVQRRFNLKIDEYEKVLETMEGTARYIEYKLQKEFATMKPDKKLMNIDTSYNSYQGFKNYNIENDPWLYKIGKSYFYSTGFNMARLLDKLEIKYKTRLFKEGNLSLEQLLLNVN